MLNYNDEIQQYNTTQNLSGYTIQTVKTFTPLTKRERNQQEYYRRLIKSGVSIEEVQKRAIKSLNDNSNRERILANCIKLNKSGVVAIGEQTK